MTSARSTPTAAVDIDEYGVHSSKICTAGAHRIRPFAETIDLAWGVLDVIGVSRVANITFLDRLEIPVFNSYRPQAAPGNLTVTCGKGASTEAALASALMEALERYCGEQHGRFVQGATFADLDAANVEALEPSLLVLDRDSGWTSTTLIDWWPFERLGDHQSVLLPAAAAFSPYDRPEGHPRLFASTSDGLAAGNSLEEATLHALYELIERDATAFGEVLRLGSEIIVGGLPAEQRRMVERFEYNGIKVRLFTFQSDIAVPVVYALIMDTQAELPMLINAGAGCHLSPEVASMRALTEAAQSRLSVISGGREDLPKYASRQGESWVVCRKATEDWCNGWPRISIADMEDKSTDSLQGDLLLVLELLQRAQLEQVFRTELTLPDLPFNVVRMVVPGLEFMHQEPGRAGARIRRAFRLRIAAEPEAR